MQLLPKLLQHPDLQPVLRATDSNVIARKIDDAKSQRDGIREDLREERERRGDAEQRARVMETQVAELQSKWAIDGDLLGPIDAARPSVGAALLSNQQLPPELELEEVMFLIRGFMGSSSSGDPLLSQDRMPGMVGSGSRSSILYRLPFKTWHASL